MQSAQIASLPEIVKLLRTLTGNSQQVSVVELAEVIQSDPLIVAKVVGAANAFAYNPNGVKVTSVHQAIHVIGYDRIRTLAMSLMLAEQVSRSNSPDEQREYAAQSLMAGCLAQALAAGRATLDKEQAFLCASLRNFGQIVLTSCMGEEFRQLRREAGGEPDDAAYRRIFGMTPLELGHQLLDAANLPEDILTTLKAMPPETFAVLESKPDDQMRALTAFAGELSALTTDPRSDPADFAAKSLELARRYEHALPRLHEEIHHVMDVAKEQLDEFVSVFRLKSLPVRIMTRMTKCRNAVDPNRPPEVVPPAVAAVVVAAPPPPAAKVPAVPAAQADGMPAPAANLAAVDWAGSLNQLTDLLRQPGMSRLRMHEALLETVQRGFGAHMCLLFAGEAANRAFPLVHGRGDLYQVLQGRSGLQVVIGERTVLGVCLARNENIIIHHAREEKIMAYLPDWLKTQDGLGAFVLLPLSDGAQVRGVLVAGWAETRQIVLPQECVRSIRIMLAMVCRLGVRLAA
ncbi:HDOD domain protein [Lacunisphaera limnophila]|uniref:HDOD domain protein n=1 Tax=Lacunisphaera limnophila TaxID=1838286 RepID=A0A1I7PHY5_9BACT|nr:HDOD domain-containing protein [Lacunisphaera limnophila]AOS43235.1 HDOD domain protein [Lacunisphaera limnophila]